MTLPRLAAALALSALAACDEASMMAPAGPVTGSVTGPNISPAAPVAAPAPAATIASSPAGQAIPDSRTAGRLFGAICLQRVGNLADSARTLANMPDFIQTTDPNTWEHRTYDLFVNLKRVGEPECSLAYAFAGSADAAIAALNQSARVAWSRESSASVSVGTSGVQPNGRDYMVIIAQRP